MCLSQLKSKLQSAVMQPSLHLLIILATLTACGDYQQAAPVDAVEISDNGAN